VHRAVHGARSNADEELGFQPLLRQLCRCGSAGRLWRIAAADRRAGRGGAKPCHTVGPTFVDRQSSGWSYRVLHRFVGRFGTHPQARLLEIGGSLYGTTAFRGKFRHGTVYGISTSGSEKVLYSFAGRSDGAIPEASLINVNGTLYGTTNYGGGDPGHGTVYSISPNGSEKVLYSFSGGADGGYPRASLIEVDGTLYGTTEYGGDSSCEGGSSPGCGTVYSISTGGSEHVLHSFTKGSDGEFPLAGLLNVNGTLYGTTFWGGTHDCYSGRGSCGTVYSVSTAGKEKLLYTFKGGSDGVQPAGGLVDVKGKLYGTTTARGAGGCGNVDVGCGVAYSMSTTGNEKVLYRFTAGADNGGYPVGDLLYANGMFYGATWMGGQSCGSSACGPGAIYSLSIAGDERALYLFGKGDGANPGAGLIDMNGVLYGTTEYGGEHCVRVQIGGCGTVFCAVPIAHAAAAVRADRMAHCSPASAPLQAFANAGRVC